MSSEYGWTDKQIGELPLARFRQIVAAIKTRNFQTQRQASSMVSWQTRVLAQFIAGGYQVAKGKGNPAADMAATLAFDDIEKAVLSEKGSTPAVAENKPGSYERFMQMDHQLTQRGKMI